MLPALRSEDQDILNHAIAHDWSVPEFKIKRFIGGSHLHPLQRVKQYLMELNTRQESLEAFEHEAKEYEILIELEQEKKEVARFNAEKKLCDLEIDSLKRKLAVTKEKFRNGVAEREKFLRVIKEFNESELGIHTDGRLYMDILFNDPEESERIEEQYWEYRLAKQSALDFIAYGRIGVGNMEAIMQLEPDAQNKTIAMAYEILIKNEKRMNTIGDAIHQRIADGKPTSDITGLVGIGRTDFINNLLEKQDDVPLIQKR